MINLAKIKNIIKGDRDFLKRIFEKHKEDIYLVLFVFLACFLCFGLGYILGARQAANPIEFTP